MNLRSDTQGDAEAIPQSSDTVEEIVDEHIPRHRHMFDPWLGSTHRLVEVIGDNLIGSWEQMEPPRQRKLREADRQNRDAIIRTIVANLAFAAAMGVEPPAIGISLRAGKQKKTRYDRDGFTGLPRIVDLLGERVGPGFVAVVKSQRIGHASSITVGPDFLDTLRQFRLGAGAFHQLPGQETIWLRRTDRDFAGNVEGRELIEYTETPETTQHRKDLARINAILLHADIGLVEREGDSPHPPTPTCRRALHRVFNLAPDDPKGAERFDLGGRLYGGWWQGFRTERRHAIHIDGEPIADLDFASMFLRLAYVEAGHAPPDGDLYANVPGLTDPRWRPGVKKVASAMLFRRSPLTRAPRGTRSFLPFGMSGPELRAAILAAHPALRGVFETGIGLHLMFRESEVLMAALLTLADEGTAALPMHDGLMVARSKADRAIRIMGDAAEAVTGHRLLISSKTFY